MEVNVLIFGQLMDITGVSGITLHDVTDSDQVLKQLHDRYPGLKNIQYACAVDKKIITSNTSLRNKSTIALLPPFSGG